MAVAVAVLVAAPWLDERLVWCGWLGAAAALLAVERIRGWWGEGCAFAGAAFALAIAFHWTPKSLAAAMEADYSRGVWVAIPIILWDAIRLAAPFWFAGRIGARPTSAWLPAGLAACALEAVWPSVFPWKLGYSQVAWPWLVQSVDLLGPEAATFAFFAHAGAIVWLLHATRLVGGGTPAPAGGRLVSAGIAAVVVCLLNDAYGLAAIAAWSGRIAAAPTLDVTLVQANPGADDGFAALQRLTAARREAMPAPDLVCWPECSGGVFDARVDSLADRERLAAWSRPNAGGSQLTEVPFGPLLLGGIVHEGHPDHPAALRQSAVLVDAAGTIRGRYDKRHLMPFGEYVPLAELWPDLRRHFPVADDFSPGSEATVLRDDGPARLGVMLCYEDMVPSAARSLVQNAANVLVVLINGAAFTSDLTLRQHRLLAQLRAVECRRSLLRCAATGQTCVVSPLGTITATLPLGAPATLDVRVPLIDTLTPAVRVGPLFPALCGAAATVWLAAGRARAWRSRSCSRP
jgi:apolipoprotein N-acyltransferase